jgi:hypothetical protein
VTFLLGCLLAFGEPLFFAVSAASAFNAISVRGLPVVLMLVARVLSTALCAAAGRAVLDSRPAARRLSVAALCATLGVQLLAVLTPYYPSNRMPGDAPWYAAGLLVYYGALLAWVVRSRALSRSA